MAETTDFTSNYNDLSTETGFQWEFLCDRCGQGYKSKFKTSGTGTVDTVLESASNIFGGVFNSASNISNEIKSATEQKDKDKAFAKAVEEVKPDLIKCPKCSSWVCKSKCWDDKKKMCKECAGSSEDENTVEESEIKCPKCNASISGNVKFCSECGTLVKPNDTCKVCGAKLTAGAKFCGSCGEKI